MKFDTRFNICGNQRETSSLFVAMVDYFSLRTKALRECRPLPRHVIISKPENLDFFFYPHGDTDQRANLMGFKLDQDPSSDFFHEFRSSSICIILLTGRQINKWS